MLDFCFSKVKDDTKQLHSLIEVFQYFLNMHSTVLKDILLYRDTWNWDKVPVFLHLLYYHIFLLLPAFNMIEERY